MAKIDNELSRMRSLMNYGNSNESSRIISNIVEHTNKGADGKTYGIIREGTHFVIKYMKDSKKPMVAENFDYIGGFSNKKENTYDSYAMALKQFDLKMMSLKEAFSPEKSVIVESLDPNRKEYLKIEATDKMKKEIARQRQIMLNAQIISEGKNSSPCRGDGTCGDAKKHGSPFGVKDNTKQYIEADEEPYNKEGEPKKVNEDEVLAWNENPDYLDTSHGTEIGDGAPFDKCPKSETKSKMKNGVVEEGLKEPAPNEVNDWDKGLPNEAGTGDVKTEDGAPFTEKVNESIFDDDDTETSDIEGDEITVDTDSDIDSNMDADTDDIESDVEEGDEEINSLLHQILDKLNSLEGQINNQEFNDDSLYDDEENGEAEDLPQEDGTEVNDDFSNDDEEFDNNQFHESKKKEKVMSEESQELDYFGKHPAYQKEPFSYPNPNHKEKEGYHDWNDDSVEGAKPYGQSIGDGQPFNVDIEAIDNSIQESIKKALKESLTDFFANKK